MRVCVEGNAACGKTTALALAAARLPGAEVFAPGAWGLLDAFRADPAGWGLAFSLQVLLSFAAAAGPTGAGPRLVERGPLSCRHVFSQLLYNEGKLTAEEWNLFKEYCDVLGWTPDLVVYVQTPADECLRRLEARGDPGGLDLQHLRRLEFQYETMLRYCDVPVVRVDGTLPPEAVAAAVADAVAAAVSRADPPPAPA